MTAPSPTDSLYCCRAGFWKLWIAFGPSIVWHTSEHIRLIRHSLFTKCIQNTGIHSQICLSYEFYYFFFVMRRNKSNLKPCWHSYIPNFNIGMCHICCLHSLLSFRNKNISFENKVVKLELKPNSQMEKPQSLDLSHHKRLEYCTNRLNYRNGRKLTAIKVKHWTFIATYKSMFWSNLTIFPQTYTIVNESRHLLVFGVPRINLHQEMKQLFGKYGQLSKANVITDTLQSNDTGTAFSCWIFEQTD